MATHGTDAVVAERSETETQRSHPPGPRPITIEEYRARQRPRAKSPLPAVPRARTRGGRRQKLRAQRRELFMLLNITTDKTQKAAYREQLKALREPPRPQRKTPEDSTPRQSEARTTTYYNKYYNKEN